MELVQQIQAKQAEAPKADKGEKKKAKQALISFWIDIQRSTVKRWVYGDDMWWK